jgi:hypothetical protein
MPDDAEMKTIIKELIKVMQKLQSQTSSETPNIQGIQLQQPYNESQEIFTTYLQ